MNFKALIPILALTISGCSSTQFPPTAPNSYKPQYAFCHVDYSNTNMDVGFVSFDLAGSRVENLNVQFETKSTQSDNGMIEYYRNGTASSDYNGHNLIAASKWLSVSTEAFHPNNTCQHQIEESALFVMIDNFHNAKYTYRIGNIAGEGVLNCQVF